MRPLLRLPTTSADSCGPSRSARPIGPVERFERWVKRRPYQAAFAALGGLAAFGGLLIHQARLRVEIDRSARAAQDTHEQKILADANYRGARATIQAILDCYSDPAFSALPHRNELQRAQAEKALIFYDRLLAGDDSPDPVVQLDTARAAREAAGCQYTVGHSHDAVASLERSIRLIDAVAVRRPDDHEVIREGILSRTKLGLIVWNASFGLPTARSLSCAAGCKTPSASSDPFRSRLSIDPTWPGACMISAPFY